MSNSTQNDHETHTSCIDRINIRGASATCCYCDPHEGCTLGINPYPGKFIPVERVPVSKTKDRALQDVSYWINELIEKRCDRVYCRMKIEEIQAKERADARKEVEAKVVEQSKILKESITADELQSGYYLSGVKRMEKAVLVTLREEESDLSIAIKEEGL